MANFAKDGTGIISIKDSNTLLKSIVRIEPNQEGRKRGTGFFAKIIHETDKTEMNFLVTNEHIIKKDMVDNKNIIDIYFISLYNPEKELNRKIGLDENKRYIKYYPGQDIDFTIIQILKTDKISDERFLLPDLDYEKGNEFYKGKICYIAGYPLSEKEGKIQEESISIGKIINYGDGFDFEHDIDTVYCSSGSPICLKDNLRVIGIHKNSKTVNEKIYEKGKNSFEEINYKRKKNFGTLFKIIIKDVNNEDSFKKIISIKNEDDINFSDVEEKIDLTEPLQQNIKKPTENELFNLDCFIFAIFFLSFTNLKLILISKENYQNVGGFTEWIYKIICFFVVLFTNNSNSFLIFIMICEVIILILNIYSFVNFPENTFQILYFYFILVASLLRVYNKDVLILKLFKNNYYKSISIYTYSEIFSNVISFIIIKILRYLSEGTFKEVLLIINFLINLRMSFILYRYEKEIDIILKKINKYKNTINNENLIEYIFNNICGAIGGFFTILLINPASQYPSYYYYNNQNDKLIIFIICNFVGRNIFFVIQKATFCKIIIFLLILALLYFIITLFEENYLFFGLKWFIYGVSISLFFDSNNEGYFTFYHFCTLFLLFMPF